MIQKRGRTLAITVDDLLVSPRFKIAIENFDTDPMLMKAILIELGHESLNVAKNTIIKEYNTHSSLAQFELAPYLRSISDFKTYNIWWKLTPIEAKLYMADPKNKLSKEDRKTLFEKFRKEMMESGEE